jgi:hypothetical protein
MNPFFLLLFGHALADYPLQQEFLAKGKCAKSAWPGIKWYYVLFWHAMIHAGFVLVITNKIELALFELVAHMLIDHMKCIGKTNYEIDQSLHILCKILYVIYLR